MADAKVKVNLEHLSELKRLEALANNGRGICCVKDVIMFPSYHRIKPCRIAAYREICSPIIVCTI